MSDANTKSNMKDILIKNGTVIDPASQLNKKSDILIQQGKFSAIGEELDSPADCEIIDAKGLTVIPGLVDLRARFREPGQEYTATIASEAKAAALAGITSVCIPPDTEPAIDRPSIANTLFDKAKHANGAKVYPISALTTNLDGNKIADLWTLANTGCVGTSNAKKAIPSVLVQRRAMQYAASFDITVHLYPQDHELYGNGCVHEGITSTRLGLSAVPAAAELVGLARDIALIETTGVKAHFMGISCARSVEMIADAQKRGLNITADVDIHHLLMNEEDMQDFDSNFHIQPPLRTKADQNALIDGVSSGVISAICSDHQPHNSDAKLAPFAETEPGISSLEILLPSLFSLSEKHNIPLSTLLAASTNQAADILNIEAGQISIGHDADCALIDSQSKSAFERKQINSQGKNSPYIGQKLPAKVLKTIISGKVVAA